MPGCPWRCHILQSIHVTVHCFRPLFIFYELPTERITLNDFRRDKMNSKSWFRTADNMRIITYTLIVELEYISFHLCTFNIFTTLGITLNVYRNIQMNIKQWFVRILHTTNWSNGFEKVWKTKYTDKIFDFRTEIPWKWKRCDPYNSNLKTDADDVKFWTFCAQFLKL